MIATYINDKKVKMRWLLISICSKDEERSWVPTMKVQFDFLKYSRLKKCNIHYSSSHKIRSLINFNE